MSKRAARRGTILFLLVLGALILGGVWVTVDAYRRESLRAPLIKAVKHADAARVQLLLLQGADPDSCEIIEPPPTIRQFLRRLLRPRRPAASNAPTALMLAAQNGRLHIAELLIARGADVNRQTGGGASSLYWAAGNEHAGIVRLLLSKGAKPDLRDKTRTTPLIAGARNPDIVQALLEHNADVNAVNNIGMTALMIAAVTGNLKSVQLLAQHGANVNAVRTGGGTPLLDANRGSQTDSFKIVKYLVEHGANPNASDGDGVTPLYTACQPCGSVEAVRLLLKHNAKVNARTRAGDTPLHEAVGNVEYDEEPGNPEVVRLLLASGADPRIKNRLGYTPLMKTPKCSPAIKHLLEAAARR